MNAVTKTNQGAVTAEQVLIRGDLSALGEAERVKYYADVCNSLGLNPLTKPFAYITLNGKLQLYALKDATDQLRSVHGISVTEMAESEREGVFVVKCKVQNAAGRTDMSTGAVNIAGLKGEALANALMKAETKAKRRATMSICGLGMMDETEIEDIPAGQKMAVRVPSPPAETKDEIAKPARLDPFKDEKFAPWSDRFIESLKTAKTVAEFDQWNALNDDLLAMIGEKAPKVAAAITKAAAKHFATIKPKDDPISTGKPKTDGPDIDADYEGFIKWCFGKINTFEDGGELEGFCTDYIQANEKALFPPDYADLVDAVGRKQAALNSDE